MNVVELAKQPLFLRQNRIWRPFKGGALIDEWQGKPGADNQMSEEWIGSVVEARNPNAEPDEGLSYVKLTNEQDVLLRDLLELAPERFLGERHVDRHGSNLSILVKVLDSYHRLMIQVHP